MNELQAFQAWVYQDGSARRWFFVGVVRPENIRTGIRCWLDKEGNHRPFSMDYVPLDGTPDLDKLPEGTPVMRWSREGSQQEEWLVEFKPGEQMDLADIGAYAPLKELKGRAPGTRIALMLNEKDQLVVQLCEDGKFYSCVFDDPSDRTKPPSILADEIMELRNKLRAEETKMDQAKEIREPNTKRCAVIATIQQEGSAKRQFYVGVETEQEARLALEPKFNEPFKLVSCVPADELRDDHGPGVVIEMGVNEAGG